MPKVKRRKPKLNKSLDQQYRNEFYREYEAKTAPLMKKYPKGIPDGPHDSIVSSIHKKLRKKYNATQTDLVRERTQIRKPRTQDFVSHALRGATFE